MRSFNEVNVLKRPMTTALATSLLMIGCAARPQASHGPTPPATVSLPAPLIHATQPVQKPPTPSPDVTENAASSRSGAVGKAAPEFTLPDYAERPTALSSFRGRWTVLYFYPSDDTPGCTCQATDFTSLLVEFDKLNATVVGVSPDSPATHEYFMRKYGLNFPLLSDNAHDVMRQYGAWLDVKDGPAAPGRVLRSTYLIDPTGKIAWHWPEVVPQGHAERVKEKLTQLAGPTTKPVLR